jgi:hypothetical protein
MLIVESISGENATKASIEDTENLLSAYRWRLPDRYWQNRSRKDLIIEFQGLLKSNDTSIDWQYLCLASEKLLLDSHWFDRSGLKNRQRILPLIEGIKGALLALLAAEH